MTRARREGLNALLIALGILSAAMGLKGFLLSSQSVAIRERITGELERGVTVYRGYGGLTGAEQEILYCVVTRLEIGKVKAIVRALDEHAFIVSHVLADAEGGVVKRAALH